MVKLVDAKDSKSFGDEPCRFESDLGHQDTNKKSSIWLFLFDYLFNDFINKTPGIVPSELHKVASAILIYALPSPHPFANEK